MQLLLVLGLLVSCIGVDSARRHAPFSRLTAASFSFSRPSQYHQDESELVNDGSKRRNIIEYTEVKEIKSKAIQWGQQVAQFVDNIHSGIKEQSDSFMRKSKFMERWQQIISDIRTYHELEVIGDNTHPSNAPSNSGEHNKRNPEKGKFTIWWRKQTAGRHGLLIFLVPAIASQYEVVKTFAPFCLDRMMQYFQPLNVMVLAAMTRPKGLKTLRIGLWTSIGIGGFKFLQDAYTAGSSWLPARPKDDSYAVITGASSNLGKELARELFSHGYNLVLVAKNREKLEDFKFELIDAMDEIEIKEESKTSPNNPSDLEKEDNTSSSILVNKKIPNIQVISHDFSDPMASYGILRELKRMKIENKIDVLICNADKGEYGSIHDSNPNDLRNVVDVNIGSTVGLVRLLLPRMLYRKKINNNGGSRILIVSSACSCGFVPMAATYSASKTFLSAFAQSLRRELLPYGVMVTLAQPGILKIPASTDSTRLSYNLPAITLSSKEAAHQIYNGMRNGHDVITPGVLNKFYCYVIAKLLPPSVSASIGKFLFIPRTASIKSKRYTHQMENKRHHRSKSLKDKIRNFWYNPILDFPSMIKWLKRLGKSHNQTRKPDIIDNSGDEITQAELSVEKFDLPEVLENEEVERELEASNHWKEFMKQYSPGKMYPQLKFEETSLDAADEDEGLEQRSDKEYEIDYSNNENHELEEAEITYICPELDSEGEHQDEDNADTPVHWV